jgi:hypothetical protein
MIINIWEQKTKANLTHTRRLISKELFSSRFKKKLLKNKVGKLESNNGNQKPIVF